jgi:hypothetical protein
MKQETNRSRRKWLSAGLTALTAGVLLKVVGSDSVSIQKVYGVDGSNLVIGTGNTGSSTTTLSSPVTGGPNAFFDNDGGTGDAQAIQGRVTGTSGRAFVGFASGASGGTIGLDGVNNSPSGIALRGANTAVSGSAVGVQGQTGWDNGAAFLGKNGAGTSTFIVFGSGSAGIGTTGLPYGSGQGNVALLGSNLALSLEEPSTSNTNIEFRRSGANKWDITENFPRPGGVSYDFLSFYDWSVGGNTFQLEHGNAVVNIDPNNLNNGSFHKAINSFNTTGAGLAFGTASGEGISSQRGATGGNQYGLDFWTLFLRRMRILQNGNIWVGFGGNSYFAVDNPTATYGLISKANLVPDFDNTYECGDPSFRWSLVRGVTITSGDLVFQNDMRVVEHGTDGLAFVDPKENIIAILDSGGNLTIKGQVTQNTQLGTVSPRKYSGATTAQTGQSASATMTATTTTTTSTTPPSIPSEPPN